MNSIFAIIKQFKLLPKLTSNSGQTEVYMVFDELKIWELHLALKADHFGRCIIEFNQNVCKLQLLC